MTRRQRSASSRPITPSSRPTVSGGHRQGFALVEQSPEVLVTFGIVPTGPATGLGYLELGRRLRAGPGWWTVLPKAGAGQLAQQYFQQGPERCLWNSGMFVWRASTLLDCIGRYKPAVSRRAHRVAEAWGRPGAARSWSGFIRHWKRSASITPSWSRPPGTRRSRVAAIPMPAKLAGRGLMAFVRADLSVRRAGQRPVGRAALVGGHVELPGGIRRSRPPGCDDRLPGRDGDSHESRPP